MNRRRAAITFLALTLVVEALGVAVVAAAEPGPRPAVQRSGVAPVPVGSAGLLATAATGMAAGQAVAVAGLAVTFGPDVPGDGRVAQVVVPPTPAPPSRDTAKTRAPVPAPAAGGASHAGRNHLWMPAFGINRPVYGFPCSRAQRPGSVVYKWGCAGRNNTYLFGHAANVFSGLYRAYLNKKIKVGQVAWYADAKGNVGKYVVRWWKLVRPTVSASNIYGPLARPSLTLQTCVGAKSEWRLIVRLEKVSG